MTRRLINCAKCGKEFEAENARRKYCGPKCFIAKDKDSYERRRQSWSHGRRTASGKIEHALTTGRMRRQPCEVCGATRDVHAHHDDYAKPFEVRWLCRSHHRQLHAQWKREGKEAANSRIPTERAPCRS